MAKDSLVIFTPSGRRGRFSGATTVLSAAQELGVNIESICGGNARCGRCQIRVSEGVHAKFGINSAIDSLSPPTAGEIKYADRLGLPDGIRLSCQAIINSDVVIDVPPASQTRKQTIRKPPSTDQIAVHSPVKLYQLTIAKDSLRDQLSNLERLRSALKDQHNIELNVCDPIILRQLPPAITAGKTRITIAIRDGGILCGCWGQKITTVYGLAIDIGTTTIAGHLCDLADARVLASAGQMNPQIRFGEDLMSRISYIQLNPPGADEKLTGAVRQTIAHMITDIAEQAAIDADQILELTIVCNPIMHHLFLGFDVIALGQAPFTLNTSEKVSVLARDLALPVGDGAMIYLLPCIAGHVGADAAGMILAEAPQERSEISLLIDVGTNAEIVLGNCDRLLACSSPTGPAFEGGQISSGQRAAPGAIERVRIDPGSRKAVFKVIGVEPWSDERGFGQQAKTVGISGICGSGIIEAIAEMFLAGIINADGLINSALALDCEHIVSDANAYAYVLHHGSPQIKITQNDVRAIQLAKAAANAGAQLLMDHMGVIKVDRIVLAGAFGSFIDPKYAMILGLIPDCPLTRVTSAGNAAGTGARIALVNTRAREKIENLTTQVEKIESALEPKFQQHFIAAMAFPHKINPYHNLQDVVSLPEVIVSSRRRSARRISSAPTRSKSGGGLTGR